MDPTVRDLSTGQLWTAKYFMRMILKLQELWLFLRHAGHCVLAFQFK